MTKKMALDITLGERKRAYAVVHDNPDHPEAVAAYMFQDLRVAHQYVDYLISKGHLVGELYAIKFDLEPLRRFDYSELDIPPHSA